MTTPTLTTAAPASPLARLGLVVALCLFLILPAAGCASDANPQGYRTEISDPLEPVNRVIFAINNVFDRFVAEPVAKIYDTVFPGFVKDSVQSFMRNLRTPLIIANNLLQGDIDGAGTATARFVINSTIGVAGLVDVAAHQGYYYEPADLGQTLAVWGMGDGVYIVLPILGPSSVRDTTGVVGEYFADPLQIWSNNTHNDWVYITRGAVEAIDKRARAQKAIDDLRKNSLDYYAAVRSAYVQHRQAHIRNARGGGAQPQQLPSYDEEY